MATNNSEIAAVISQHRLKLNLTISQHRLKIEELNQALREGKVKRGREYLVLLAEMDSEYRYEIHKLDIWCWQEIHKLKV